MENMKKQLMEYIDYCLGKAAKYSDSVDVYMHQAYGAMTFYCLTIYKNNPDAEIEMTDYWNDVIYSKFLDIKTKGD